MPECLGAGGGRIGKMEKENQECAAKKLKLLLHNATTCTVTACNNKVTYICIAPNSFKSITY